MEKLQNLAYLRDLLKQNSLISDLACTPINLEILCCLYFFEETVYINTLTNITSFYFHIINWLYKQFLLKPGLNQETKYNIHTKQNLRNHQQIYSLASKLEKIAWYGVKKQIHEFDQYILENEFKLDIETVIELGLLKVKNKTANFIHLTFQEYFAATYLANYYIKGKHNKIKEEIAKNKFNPSYTLVFAMTAGYLYSLNEPEALQKFFNDLISKPYDLKVNYELNLLTRCFAECKNPSIIKQYSEFIEYLVIFIQDNWPTNSHFYFTITCL